MENENIKQPLVSIIIPAYNAEPFIGLTIDSIKSQTIEDWELVIVDDGSRDKTPTICDAYAARDKRIRVIHKQNGGVSAARNTGIEAATGKYIAFIDADDCIIPQYLEAFVTSIGDADICLFPMQEVNNRSDIPIFKVCKNFESTRYNLQDGYPILSDRGMIHPPFCKIFSFEKILQNGLRFDPKIAMGEDLLFNLSYLDHCKTMVIGEEPVYYYIKGNSVLSRTIRKDYADLQIRFYYEREQFCQRHGINYTLQNQRFSILYDAYSSIARAKNLTRTEKRKALLNIRHSSVAKEYLKECKPNNSKERMFQWALKLPVEFLFI